MLLNANKLCIYNPRLYTNTLIIRSIINNG